MSGARKTGSGRRSSAAGGSSSRRGSTGAPRKASSHRMRRSSSRTAPKMSADASAALAKAAKDAGLTDGKPRRQRRGSSRAKADMDPSTRTAIAAAAVEAGLRGSTVANKPRSRSRRSSARKANMDSSTKAAVAAAAVEAGLTTAKKPAASGALFRAVGVAEEQNRMHRRTMEDAHRVVEKLGGSADRAFFGVYDGHQGKKAAVHCGEHMHELLLAELNKQDGRHMEQIWPVVYAEMDKKILADGIEFAGTTVITTLLQRNKAQGTRTLFCANAGDARTVVARGATCKAKAMTYDHKAEDAAEAARITAKGGFVANGRTLGQIALARSLGDHHMKDYIINTPHVSAIDVAPDDRFVIMACDGLWDVMDNQAAVDLVKGMDMKNPEAMAQALIDTALEKGSDDNLTVMVIVL